MRCLVTGGAGFLGSHMAARLRRDGHEVSVLDRDAISAEDAYRVDIAGSFILGRAFDWVFHFAGLAAIGPSMSSPARYLQVNTLGTAHVLQVAVVTGVRRFLYAASGTCYGFQPPEPTPETAPIVCETPYALSKWLGEEAVRHWDRVFNLPSVSLRLFSPYGPGMGPTSALGQFLKLRAEGKAVEITGDGTQSRDMHYVDDCVEAFVRAAESDLRDVAINIGSGAPQTINRLVDLLGVEHTYAPARREASGTWADISLAKQLLGWAPTVSFEEGIRRTLTA